MERPRIICHMVTSLDGKVTGAFLNTADKPLFGGAEMEAYTLEEAVPHGGDLWLHYTKRKENLL